MAVATAPTSVDTVTTATWRAMGTRVVVEAVGPNGLVEHARDRVDALESRWSRFLPNSDVSRMNELRGLPVFVHPDTRRLVRHAIAAWCQTDGACDATAYDAVLAAGYGVTFESVGDHPPVIVDPPIVPGCGEITVDDELGAVVLPAGAGFDPGAIGKGLAADLVVEDLMSAGASSVFVSLGGDICMAGRPPHGDGWLIDVVDHADDPTRIAQLALGGGAVATSTTTRRRWQVGERVHHHVIDPRTGRPAESGARTACVIAGEAWQAEALATQLLLAEPQARADVVGDGAALVVNTDGEVEHLGVIDRYLR